MAAPKPVRVCRHYQNSLPSHFVGEILREVADPDTNTTEEQSFTADVSFKEFADAHFELFPNLPKPAAATYGDRELAAIRLALRKKIQAGKTPPSV